MKQTNVAEAYYDLILCVHAKINGLAVAADVWYDLTGLFHFGGERSERYGWTLGVTE